MIDRKEIRIGVFINDHEGNPFQVKAIDFDYNDDNFPPVFYVNHKPLHTCTEIPLTPEWLERFGFEDKKDFYENGILSIQYNKRHYAWCTFIESHSGIANGPCIKYVHQLQNLAFALNSKELELKK